MRADPSIQPQLFTHQSYVEEVKKIVELNINDMMAVFSFVFSSLSEVVKVYPTENYYYFNFFCEGIRYSGNIRLDVQDRDDGKVHFAYFEDMTEWKNEESPINYVILDKSVGVFVEKQNTLLYRVSYAGKNVLFVLNDLSNVVPPPSAIGPYESYIGPIFGNYILD